MGYRYGRSDFNEISIWDMGYRFGIRYIVMLMYHIDMAVLDIDVGYGLMIWEMTVSIWSSFTSMRDILSLCLEAPPRVCVDAIMFYTRHLPAYTVRRARQNRQASRRRA